MGLLIFPPLLEWIMTSLSSIVLAICLVLGLVVPAIAEHQVQEPSANLRNPKLFYVSTSTTTSTQKSLTFCFQRITASFALQRCTGRRKRGEVHELLDDDDDDVDVDQLHGDEHLRLHHLLSHWLHTCHMSQRLGGAEEKLASVSIVQPSVWFWSRPFEEYVHCIKDPTHCI